MNAEAPPVELGDGRYRVQRRLGSGGMATVWLAHDERLGRPVAIKVIADTLAADPEYLRRFAREARLAAGLTHPNLVGVYDFSAEPPPFLVMEFVDGGTLADRLARTDAVPAETARTIAADLLSALEVVHAAGIVHRDIKPANVLVGSDTRVRLTDFGIARDVDATQLTQTGKVIGTLRYLAPEVLQGEPATTRSDLYALGRLIEELGGPAPLIAQLTETDPERRPVSALDAAAQLHGDHSTSRVRPTTYRRRTRTALLPTRRLEAPQAERRGRLPAVLAIIGAVLILAAVILAGTADDETAPRAAEARPIQEQLDRLERLVISTRK